MECWASILGRCAGGQSREHYITKGLYPGLVKAVGLPWAKGEPIELPIEALAANILCAGHNNALSPVDGEAIAMKEFMADAMAGGPAYHEELHGKTRYCSVDGEKIIRWLCKMVCNIEALAKRNPDPAYIRRAFGAPGGERVRVYPYKALGARVDADLSHLRFWQWHVDLKKGGRTQVYLFRFAILEWLLSPFPLTKDECDALGQLTGGRYWFKARPLTRSTPVYVPRSGPGGKQVLTHQLTVKFPRRRRKRRR